MLIAAISASASKPVGATRRSSFSVIQTTPETRRPEGSPQATFWNRAHQTLTWKSERQKVVALSTTEEEYVAACYTVKELIWVKRLLHDSTPTAQTTVLHVDNQIAIRLIKDPEFHKRSKHIDIRYHFIRDMYEEKEFELEYVGTSKQQADIFTKPLTKNTLQRQRDILRILEKSDMEQLN